MTEVANLLRQASVVFQFFGGKLSFQRATVLQCTDSLRRLNTNCTREATGTIVGTTGRSSEGKKTSRVTVSFVAGSSKISKIINLLSKEDGVLSAW